MKALLVAVVLLLSAPAGASAALDVYFNVDRDLNGVDAGQVLAREDGQFSPGGRMSVALERGGQIIATSSPDTGPIISGVVPQPGDRLHVVVNGAERAVVPFDGRPTIDGD